MPENATLLPELRLAAATGSRYIAGVDEVGRGALAGPVTIGVSVFDMADPLLQQVSAETGVVEHLDGVRDSKLLTAKARTRWSPIICEHAAAFSVQHRQAEEIDAVGIGAAMRSAGLAALNAVEQQMGTRLDAVVLDGSHDWLTGGTSERVRCEVKADVRCLTVACASVIAKVERDRLMEELAVDHPEYGWHSNRGYGSAAHRQALATSGVTPFHRRSWNLGV